MNKAREEDRKIQESKLNFIVEYTILFCRNDAEQV